MFRFSCMVTFTFVLYSVVVESRLAPRVYGGTGLQYGDHKYLVGLRTLYRHHKPSFCSGSIVDRSWIITSAHCVDLPDIWSIAVDHHQSDKQFWQIAKVDMSKIFLHPRYVPSVQTVANRAFDLALLKTRRPISFSEFVGPIKMLTKSPRLGQEATIAAYGNAERGLAHREGRVQIEWCPFAVPNVLCTLSTVRAGDGDSGGALTANGRLVGVISASCRDVHVHAACVTLYTSVGGYAKWIRSVIASN